MNCSKCQGLCVEESSHDGSALRWEWKCLNCGKREPIQSAKIVLTPPAHNKADLGEARLVSMAFKEKRMIDPPAPRCSVKDCKRPKADNSTQCERHRDKNARANVRYRERAKMALNGASEGTTWKSPILLGLVQQRDALQAKIAELDKAITVVKGL